MRFEVLVTTMNKTRHDILDMCQKINLSTDALFANQCGKNDEYHFMFKNHNVRVLCTDSIGVSKNRNILLNNCTGDYCICIDDDCSLVDGYEDLINKFLSEKGNPDCVSFNGKYVMYDKLVTNKKTRKIRHFSNISYAGAPGFVFKKDYLLKTGILYNESVGVPNKICAGEDSLFYYQLVKRRNLFYRCNSVLFTINNYENESSYYNGIDEKYVSTRGYITYLLHHRLYRLYMLRHVIRFHKTDKTKSLRQLSNWFLDGVKYAKNQRKN